MGVTDTTLFQKPFPPTLVQFSVTFFFKSEQMRKLFIIGCWLLVAGNLNAQEFGGNPPSLKWKQINTDTARIIFPDGLEAAAQRVAAVVHFLAAKNTSLGSKADKINIVLQNQTAIANGYVGLGPYRSEFMMTPSISNFDLGSVDWASSLASHEYRHVQQFNNFKTGLSKAMYYLFGEEGLALAINASVPDWFYEGDAVYNETVHTQQGRGRIPFFTNQYKSLWLDDKKYTWMKLRNGSHKDYVPNHYPLGYLLVNYGYEKYGTDFWKNVTQDAASFKGLFYPFQKAIKQHAGVDYKTFRKEAFAYYKQSSDMQYKSATQQKTNQGTEAGEQKITTATSNYVTNYFFPYHIGNDSLLYLKSSYRKRPAFVLKNTNGEKVLRVKDISLDEHYSYRNGKIVYAAYKPDARWRWRDFGEIKLLDVNTGEQKKITHRSKYFAPDISADGTKIAAVSYDVSGKSEVHIINTANGEVLQRINANSIALFTDPKFIDDNSLLSCIRFKEGSMSMVRIILSTGAIEYLLSPTWAVIGFPNVQDGIVYFTASFTGNDELYAYHLNERKMYKVTGSQLGNYFASAGNGKITFAAFTADGYQLKTKETKLNFEPFDVRDYKPAGNYKVANTEFFRDKNISDAAFAGRQYAMSNYRKGTKLLNFHSWRPYYEDPVFTYSFYGENVLNTLQTELYYLYNQNENTNAVGFSTVFGSLFPFISAGTEYTFKRTDTLNNLSRQWNQLDSRIGLSIPLNFTGGRFFRNLNFGSSYVFRVENNTGPNKNLFNENNFSYLSHFIIYSQQVQMARQHIFPRFGYSFSLQHRHAITKYDSYQFLANANFYLPGFFATHSVVLNASFQQRDTFRVLYSNRFAYSRGFNEAYLSRMWKLGANYHFPLWIPDWGFGNILYIKRIRANAFYDFTKVYSRNKLVTVNQRSAGAEFYFDTNWWNQYPLTFGFRISRLLDDDLFTGQRGTYFEIILPVSIIPR